ncbi:MAG: VWA domain-containing protein [Polyangiales bacterium]
MFALACDPSGGSMVMRDGGVDDAALDGDLPPAADADGDGIGDDWEDSDTEVDTDGDGTPDFRDTDSDGDGIPDSVERGVGGGSSSPADSDGDGTYDFRDLDSDGNGIDDETEGTSDADGDGSPDFADLDDDNDTLRDSMEIGDDPSNPLDFDGDGLPDFRDVDSDDDNIGDRNEAFPADTDMDGTPDRHDLDSDDDGWSDIEEAGDDDVFTAPVDTDEDGTPDFRDTDSDGDGLSDAAERELGTNRADADSDGDGVTDLVEIGACDGNPECVGDALDPDSSPRTRGDFVFFMPYEAEPSPPRDTLDFATNIQVADVYFLIDTTGSMSGAIANVTSSLSTPGTGIIDQVRASIPQANFGIGEFKDFGDGVLYVNRQDISANPADSQAAVATLRASGGGDGPEGGIPAAFSAITGTGMSGAGAYPNRTGCPAGTFGYPCFRDGAVPILVIIMDNFFHNGPGNSFPYNYVDTAGTPISYARTVTALNAGNARAVGVAVTGTTALAHLQTLATDTNTVDAGGMPLVSQASSSGVSAGVVTQIQTLANSVAFDISTVFEDDGADAVDTFAAFVDRVEANEMGDAGRGCDPRMGEDTDGDTFPDVFRDVSGERVCFDIVVKSNVTVEPTTEPQVFNANVRVLGDAFTELDSRQVFFLVPPIVEGPGIPL